jgi:signal transduction histidine kinase/DNA-binding response OmpR family regulator
MCAISVVSDASGPDSAAGPGFLRGGGEMGARMRTHDWAATPLGPAAQWPQSLKTVVRVMLDSRYAMWMLWGPELTFFCNDAYLPTVGIKRDWVLGARSDKVWEEIWPDIGPRITRVLEGGEATWDEALLLFLERSGFSEETYHTFSYSPVYDDASRIAGMLCVVTEVTERVIGERRLRALRDLAARAAGMETVQEACDRLIGVLGENPWDVPFACLYLLAQDGDTARLAACVGDIPARLRPESIALDEAISPWPLAAALASGEAQPVRLPTGVSLVLPVQRQGSLSGVALLIVGLSPRRALDDSYRGFFDLIAAQFAAAIVDAQQKESDRRRAEALAEIDRAKTTFFSNVSHEFRTPLTLMLGPIEAASANPATPAPVRAGLELAHRNSLRLLKLVNSLLDFSRIEAGRLQASFESVDAASLTRDLASNFRSAMESAGLALAVDCEPIDESLFLDREMWEKIVLNLLSNAFKFTFAGTIAVRLRREGAEALLEVADSGVGIPQGEIPRLFERFHRVESTKGRTQEGSGIGLALVHELVKVHGGHIEVSSALGRGTTFLVRIPLGTAHLPAERIKVPRSPVSSGASSLAYVQEALRWIPSGAGAPLAFEEIPAAVADRRFSATAGARVLIADDNADMREYLRDLLAAYYTVETVPDGQDALAAIARHRPDLVLCDVMMPRIDGFALLKALRSDESLRSTPLILLSARAGEESRIEGLAAGADDYLAKPFSARELTARIGAHLELARVRREATAALSESEERLRLALDAASMATFVWDIDTGQAESDERMLALLGLPPGSTLGFKRALDIMIHPEDEPRYAQAVSGALEPGGTGELQLDIRVRHPDDAVRWIAISGRVQFEGAPPRALRVAGVAMDITQRKRVEDALRQRTLQNEALINQAPLGMFVIDADFRMRQINPVAVPVFADMPDIVGMDLEQILRRLWRTPFADQAVAQFRRTLETGESYIAPELVEQRLDRGVMECYEWQIHRMPLPGARPGVVCYFRDISAHVMARNRLEAADRQKNEFLAMLAHELRNPLAPIRNASELLSRSLPATPRGQAVVDMLKRQVSVLVRLVDDLLDVSRITQGRITLKRRPVLLAEIIAQAMETVEPLIQEKHHEISVVSYRPLRVYADPTRLVQCVVNVLTNAAKYTQPHGVIRVETAEEAGEAVLTIADNGPGITFDLLPHIFDLFVQSERTLDRSQGGLGIGLSLVKRLIEMHGGRTVARSPGPGEGSTFEIRLPLSGQDIEQSRESQLQMPAARILVVDDNADAADSLGSLLQLEDHTVLVTYTSADALAQLGEFEPDIVLLDIGLPEIDGYEVARRIRSSPDHRHMRLIALTGYGQADDRQRAKASGFDDHLVKPVEFLALQRVLAAKGSSLLE